MPATYRIDIDNRVVWSYSWSALRAVVAGSDVAFGLARAHELLRRNLADALMVFRDRAVALAWLGLPATWEPPPAAPTDPIFDSSRP